MVGNAIRMDEKANENEITQITRPEIVHDFIKKSNGLMDACLEYTPYLATYAPQLLIPGFGSVFEAILDEWLKVSKANKRKSKYTCDEIFALHDPEYGRYDKLSIACNFVQGQLNGPDVKYYETFDYLVFFLSSNSEWIPNTLRETLLDGIIEWGVWFTSSDFLENENIYHDIFETDLEKDYVVRDLTISEVQKEIEKTKQKLKISDSTDNLVELFLGKHIIQSAREEVKKKKTT
jgi:hypothetical protein